jgi:hypothetical protein
MPVRRRKQRIFYRKALSRFSIKWGVTGVMAHLKVG